MYPPNEQSTQYIVVQLVNNLWKGCWKNIRKHGSTPSETEKQAAGENIGRLLHVVVGKRGNATYERK